MSGMLTEFALPILLKIILEIIKWLKERWELSHGYIKEQGTKLKGAWKK